MRGHRLDQYLYVLWVFPSLLIQFSSPKSVMYGAVAYTGTCQFSIGNIIEAIA